MPVKHRASTPHPVESELGLERLVFFSDAVMAIAITLLAIDIKVPEIPAAAAAEELPTRLNQLAPQIVSFVISFTVIGIYWSGHHRNFSLIKNYDGRLIMLNLIFLFFIATMPFTSGLLGRYAYLPIGVVPYAADVAAIGLSMSAIWWYASGSHRLIDKAMDVRLIWMLRWRPLATSAVFILSIPIAFFNPFWGTWIWLLAPVASWIAPSLTTRARK
jgi:uncharacterized membrane protein